MVIPLIARSLGALLPKVIPKSPVTQAVPKTTGWGGMLKVPSTSTTIKGTALGTGIGIGGLGISSAIDQVNQTVGTGGTSMLLFGGLAVVVVIVAMKVMGGKK